MGLSVTLPGGWVGGGPLTKRLHFFYRKKHSKRAMANLRQSPFHFWDPRTAELQIKQFLHLLEHIFGGKSKFLVEHLIGRGIPEMVQAPHLAVGTDQA